MKILNAKTLRNGTAVGRVFKLIGKTEIKKNISSDIETEENRLHIALIRLKEVMQQEIFSADKTAAGILTAQLDMLSDESYQTAVEQALRQEHYTAEYAAFISGEKLAQEFDTMADEYLRTRAEDVRQVSARLADVILGSSTEKLPDYPVILLAEEFTPAQLSAVDKNKVLGLAAHKGSPTSHTAILATNYGFPYLTELDLSQVESGVMAVIDGENSRLVLEPDEEFLNWAQQKIAEDKEISDSAPSDTCMKVYCNISSLEDLEKALAQNADGIGLFRTEFLFMNRESAPSEAEQLQIYRTAVEKMTGREVIIRTIDIGTDKPVHYLNLPKEENPQLGLRGVRVSLNDPELFRVQLRALLQAASYGDLGIMFPMITSAKEILAIKEQVKLAEAELKEQGKAYKMPKLGIMIETPAAALCSGELAELVDFFSIGTNDLTQYTLALDRQGEGLEYYYEPHHEAVYKLIGATVEGAHAHGITVGLCGELGGNKKALPRLVEMGLDEVSVGAAVIPEARRIIACCEVGQTVKTEKEIAEDDNSFASPSDGRLITMEEIPDKTFALGMLGTCFGVEPSSGDICAPVSGTVEIIAETKHAVTICTADGKKVMVHIGIGTVKLEGKPFNVLVKEKQQVKKGDLLVRADLEQIKAGGCSTVTVVVLLKE